MKKLMIAAAAAMAMTTGAHATIFGGNDTTNNTYNNQTYGGQGGNGGHGGAGGQGGTGVGVGVGIGAGGHGGAGGNATGGTVVGSGNSSATGGAVLGSGNSTVRNDVNNTNNNANLQGQQQGQGQSQSSKNSNRNDNRSSASNSNSNANYGNNAQTNVSVQGDTVSYEAAKIPVATAYAPNIMPTAPCKFGVSGGGQGMTFGFSLGVSITDENCEKLEQIRSVSVILGQREVAQEMMKAAFPLYAEAVARLKNPPTTRAAAPEDVTVGTIRTVHTFNDQDPFIRARVGLPPLN